ncbi:MAG: molybdopterin cofactor-binding domain-containing protein, partial [Candidatus Acidiferrales bacterium]
MSRGAGISRREFVKAGAYSGAGLVLTFHHLAGALHAADAETSFAPSVYLRIPPEGKIQFWVTRSEMGQGVRTTLPMLLAEELEVECAALELLQAPTIPAFKEIRLRTSGSGSSVGTARTLRKAGATAREMLVTAAAAEWSVDRGQCRAENGFIVSPASGRRLSYGHLAAAAAKLDPPKEVPLKDPKNFRLVGKPVKRLDGPDIVQGRARYGFDVRVPQMCYAAVARCPYLGGKALSWDDKKAKAVPGVRELVPVTTGIATGVAVTADNSWAALQGAKELQVTWDPGPNRDFSTESYFKSLHDSLDAKAFLCRQEGDAEKSLDGSVKRVEAVYEYSFQAHAPMEPMNCTADVRKDSCEIWAPTQCPEVAQQEIAKLLGLPAEAVKVNITLLGGGFGRRLFADYVPEAVEISRAVGRPVQVVWSRSDDIRHGFFNPAAVARLSAGIDAQQKPIALHHKQAASDLSMFGPPGNANDPQRYAKDGDPWGAYDNPYNFPALTVEFVPVPSPVPTGPWRAVEYPSSTFFRESFVDELAHATGIDPLSLRLELLKPGDVLKLPDQPIDRTRLSNVLQIAAEKSGWLKPLPKMENGRRWGRGIGCNTYFGESYIAQVAEVSVGTEGDVRVHRIVCVIDCGLVLNPLGLTGQAESAITWGLSAALKSQITFRNGGAVQSNYLDFP